MILFFAISTTWSTSVVTYAADGVAVARANASLRSIGHQTWILGAGLSGENGVCAFALTAAASPETASRVKAQVIQTVTERIHARTSAMRGVQSVLAGSANVFHQIDRGANSQGLLFREGGGATLNRPNTLIGDHDDFIAAARIFDHMSHQTVVYNQQGEASFNLWNAFLIQTGSHLISESYQAFREKIFGPTLGQLKNLYSTSTAFLLSYMEMQNELSATVPGEPVIAAQTPDAEVSPNIYSRLASAIANPRVKGRKIFSFIDLIQKRLHEEAQSGSSTLAAMLTESAPLETKQASLRQWLVTQFPWLVEKDDQPQAVITWLIQNFSRAFGEEGSPPLRQILEYDIKIGSLWFEQRSVQQDRVFRALKATVTEAFDDGIIRDAISQSTSDPSRPLRPGEISSWETLFQTDAAQLSAPWFEGLPLAMNQFLENLYEELPNLNQKFLEDLRKEVTTKDKETQTRSLYQQAVSIRDRGAGRELTGVELRKYHIAVAFLAAWGGGESTNTEDSLIFSRSNSGDNFIFSLGLMAKFRKDLQVWSSYGAFGMLSPFVSVDGSMITFPGLHFSLQYVADLGTSVLWPKPSSNILNMTNPMTVGAGHHTLPIGPLVFKVHGAGTTRSHGVSWSTNMPLSLAQGLDPMAADMAHAGVGPGLPNLLANIAFTERLIRYQRARAGIEMGLSAMEFNKIPGTWLGRSMGSLDGIAHAMAYSGDMEMVRMIPVYSLMSPSNPETLPLQTEQVYEQLDRGEITGVLRSAMDRANSDAAELSTIQRGIVSDNPQAFRFFGNRICLNQGHADQDAGPTAVPMLRSLVTRFLPLAHQYEYTNPLAPYLDQYPSLRGINPDNFEGTHFLVTNWNDLSEKSDRGLIAKFPDLLKVPREFWPKLRSQSIEYFAVSIWGFYDYMLRGPLGDGSPWPLEDDVVAQNVIKDFYDLLVSRKLLNKGESFLSYYARKFVKAEAKGWEMANPESRSVPGRLKKVQNYWEAERLRVLAVLQENHLI